MGYASSNDCVSIFFRVILFLYRKIKERNKMEAKKKVGLNAIFLAVTLIVNALSAFGFINGTTQSDVSNEYFTLITPSGMTFSIWSVIYGLLILSLIIMYVKRDDGYYQAAIHKITPLFIVSCILNIAWIVLFSFVLVEISTIVILAYAIVLVIICTLLLQIHDGNNFLLPITFGLYAGWLIIATVVNIATSLVKMDWDGFGLPDNIWAITLLVLSVLLMLYLAYRTENAVIPLPVAWAYLGIYQNLITAHDGEHFILQVVAIVGMVVLIGVAAVQFYKNRYHILPREVAHEY